ncbi:hypothetical protein ACOMHN_051127 [Nucella lapillus]
MNDTASVDEWMFYVPYRVLPNQPSEAGRPVVKRRQSGGCPIETQFQESRAKLAKLGEPRRDVKMQLFALFQQATVGKCDMAKPDRKVNFANEAKWDAWNQLQTMPREEAKRRYIELVEKVASGSGVSRSFYTKSSSQQVAVLGEWSDDLRVNKHGHVIYIRFNRPYKKNALSLRMYDEIALTLEMAAEDPEIYLVVVTGTGDYYCSGNDLSNLTNIDPGNIEAQTRESKAVIKLYTKASVFQATFHTPFMQLGQCPVGCSSYTFPKMMGSAKAGEMLMFNRKLTAQGACDRNLVTQVFSEDIFHRETEALIEGFAELPPQGLQTTKMLLRKSERKKLLQVNEEECEALLDRWKSEECWHAVMSDIHRRTEDNMDDV